ncbi:unnamed protein product [Paramecium octaurelia]|uniref:WD40-repeat-containing domain n=1 Tax=Paramecium octaurelia TaxID=43137 RepID=A0A8S1TW26_PAROT|nr:unnamed protein product [Paramecium octaurelia]
MIDEISLFKEGFFKDEAISEKKVIKINLNHLQFYQKKRKQIQLKLLLLLIIKIIILQYNRIKKKMANSNMLHKQIESSIKGLEMDLDSIFDNISNFIDQQFIMDSPIKLCNPKNELSWPKIFKFHLIESEFQLMMLQIVKPLINYKIKDQLHYQLQSDEPHLKKSKQTEFTQKQELTLVQSPSSQLIQKPLTYQIINNNSFQEQKHCRVIAANKDCSIVAFSCYSQIIINEFNQGMMKEIQVLNEHRDYIYTLNFMKKSDQLISGDNGGSIIIWGISNDNLWYSSQLIKGHNNYIMCLLMNNQEDLIISSSGDNIIKFWINQGEWIFQQSITNHTDSVNQISLNDQQDKIVSCGYDNTILVIEYNHQNNRWIVIQNINVDCLGFRICFINNDLFSFQPYQGNLIDFYELKSETKKFTKSKTLIVNEGNDGWQLFPQQYIKEKQLLVSKHDKFVNFITKSQNNIFYVEQSIQFNTNCTFGLLSNDGEYFIIWDDQSQQIQIRQYGKK